MSNGLIVNPFPAGTKEESKNRVKVQVKVKLSLLHHGMRTYPLLIKHYAMKMHGEWRYSSTHS
jgi:hypothetical protein